MASRQLAGGKLFLRLGYNVKITAMKIKKMRLTAPMLCALLGVGGCNTISFFPTRAAEKAADKVIGDVIPGSSAEGASVKPKAAKPAPPSSALLPSPPLPAVIPK